MDLPHQGSQVLLAAAPPQEGTPAPPAMLYPLLATVSPRQPQITQPAGNLPQQAPPNLPLPVTMEGQSGPGDPQEGLDPGHFLPTSQREAESLATWPLGQECEGCADGRV